LKRLQSSDPLHTKNESNLLLARIMVCIESFFLLAGALLFVKKIRQKAALFQFGLWDVGILQIFNSRAIILKTIVDFPEFLIQRKRSKFVP
jgi:hypothetical protein